MGEFFSGWRRKWPAVAIPVVIFTVALLAFVSIRVVLDLFRPIVTVQINTEAPGFSAADVEVKITMPLEVHLAGLPGAKSVLVASEPGLSVVLITSNRRIDAQQMRQTINGRLEQFDPPPGCTRPQLVPISTEGLRLKKSRAYQ